MGDLLVWLIMEVIFGYLFYITGAVILRIVSFGRSKVEIYSFGSYRNLKRSKARILSRAYFVGLLFYLVLISTLVTLHLNFT